MKKEIWRCDLKSPCVKLCESENEKNRCGINYKKRCKMKNLLVGFPKEEVEFFIDYVAKLKNAKVLNRKTNQWENRNEWALKKNDAWFADLFKVNSHTKLRFDGDHITINQNGLSYDYIAYKNRLLVAYPETKLSFSEVYKDDVFNFSNNSDGVVFKHEIGSPFSRNTNDIIGAYCVIKNSRGQFLTLLDKNEIEKHRAAAKTDSIWKLWYVEMVYKTVIKKATRIHYEDIYTVMNDEDNKEIELSSLPEKKVDKFLLIKELIKKYRVDELEFLKYFKVKAISELNFEEQEKAVAMINSKYNKGAINE